MRSGIREYLIVSIGVLSTAFGIPADESTIQKADSLYREMKRSSGAAAERAGMAARRSYAVIMANGAPEHILYRYADTVSTVHFSLDIGTCDEKKRAYRDALALIAKCSTNTNTSAVYHLSSALLFARMIDCADAFEIAGSGYADRIRYHLDRCLSLGNNFAPDLTFLFYGRLHAIAPHVPIFQTWPDKAKAREYYERSLAINPNSLVARFFHADLLHDAGDRDRAMQMFRDIARVAPSADDRASDTKTIAMCKTRMKAFGIAEQ
ncbi:MAG: hypothetical protein AABZ39_06050 [Spirochaetota bacterium]